MSFISGGSKAESQVSVSESASFPSEDETTGRESKGQWRIGGEEIREVVEGLVGTMWEKARNEKLEKQFKVITYDEAMRKVSYNDKVRYASLSSILMGLHLILH